MVKAKVNPKLTAAFEAVQPKNPALSSADKTYLRGLRRRGFTEPEITEIAAKAGMQVPADLFVPQKQYPKKPAVAPVKPAH